MTIIHLLIGLGSGGAEHFVLELANQNKLQGYKVYVISISSIDRIKKKFIDNGITTISLGVNKPTQVVAGFKKLLAIVNDNEEVLIHAHMFHAAMFGCFIKLLKPSVPLVFTLNNNYVKRWYRRLIFFLTRPLRNADIILSENSRQWYQKSDSVVISNGIDISRFQLPHNPPELFTILVVGRLQEQKNPFYFVDLVLLLKEKYSFKINVVGVGGLKDQLIKKIAEKKIEGYFNFLGYREDIPELLSQSHCLIMPSLWEGMPVALLEAGAAGVPVIATPVGSIPAILNNENGYVADISTFHLAVQNVIDNYAEALNKASVLKKEVEGNYDIYSNSLRHIELYQKVLKKVIF
jgi:glycosyltransferase involved in cell wall biosynthesis